MSHRLSSVARVDSRRTAQRLQGYSGTARLVWQRSDGRHDKRDVEARRTESERLVQRLLWSMRVHGPRCVAVMGAGRLAHTAIVRIKAGIRGAHATDRARGLSIVV